MHVSLTDELIVIMRECARLTKMESPNVNVGRNSPGHSVMIPSCPGCKVNIAAGIQNEILKNLGDVI